MKTIEVRATEYSNRYERVKLTRLRAYIDGATEQKKIDDQHILFLADAHEYEKKMLIDKACKTYCKFCPIQCDNHPHDDCTILIEYKTKLKGE